MIPSDTKETVAPPSCPSFEKVISLIGDKWTIRVVVNLSRGSLRFNELRRAMGGITQKMLTRSLRKLEEEDILSRTVYPTVPPSVEYALTDYGSSLIEPVKGLCSWAAIHRERKTRGLV
ncbi:MAG: helix-turn-helix transcriptional regulator [Alphaproteobacteria bacterium]|nr:helix-turn-helix transcriptional regulator [Alphaproteobacteria bacterium]